MAYIPTGITSIVNTIPSSVLVGASIYGSLPPSSVMVLNPVSVLAVTGTLGASVIGHAPVVIVGGSVAASFTPPANQSVSGTIHVDNFSSVTSYQLAGSILAVSGSFAPAANQSVSGTVQVDVRGSIATVIIGGSIASAGVANQSVSGTVGASVIGTVPVTQATTEWTVKSSLAGGIFPVSGSVSAVVTNFPTSQNVSGSVVAFQGTPEWTVKSSIAGGIFPISGSVAVGNFPTNQNVSGSVVAFQGAGWSGSVAAVQVGTRVTSLVSTVPSSVIVGASIFGQLPAGTAMLGSVVAYQGAVWNVAGSVAAFQAGTQITSIAGIPNVTGSLVGVFSNTSSVYAVLSSITTISVMNANANRLGATIYNDAGTTVFIKLGTAATTSVYTVAMVDDSYYEVPYGWKGVVAGISASNAGRINVTELT